MHRAVSGLLFYLNPQEEKIKPYEIEAVASEPSLHEFSMDDYLDAAALWRDTPGVGLSNSDQPGAIAAFLARNPGLSFVARHGRALAGTVLCGHEGRRGHLYHVAVEPLYRRGIGADERMDLDLYSLAAPTPAGKS